MHRTMIQRCFRPIWHGEVQDTSHSRSQHSVSGFMPSQKSLTFLMMHVVNNRVAQVNISKCYGYTPIYSFFLIRARLGYNKQYPCTQIRFIDFPLAHGRICNRCCVTTSLYYPGFLKQLALSECCCRPECHPNRTSRGLISISRLSYDVSKSSWMFNVTGNQIKAWAVLTIPSG